MKPLLKGNCTPSDIRDVRMIPGGLFCSIFPEETFRVLKEKELRLYGEYRTRRLVLEAWIQLG